jgi:hypothetical protein
MVTSLTVKTVEIEVGDDKGHALPENTTLTAPLSVDVIGRAIGDVVARADRGYALDVVTMLQIKARLSKDTGERLSLDEFASQEGFDLAQLRSE